MNVFFILFILNGCVSGNSQINFNRLPAEVTNPGQENPAGSPVLSKSPYELFRTLEIPTGSFFKMKDLTIESKNCNISYGKAPYTNLDEVLVYFGFDVNIQGANQRRGQYLPVGDGCPNGFCRYEEYFPAPYNMLQIIKIWSLPNDQITRMEVEYRRGPQTMSPENMALQLKATCTSDFVGV